MNFDEFKAIFLNNARLNGVEDLCHSDVIEKFMQLTDIMIETNKVMNITAIKKVEDIISLHYVDCIKLCPYLPENAYVLDVGCGGGFPTLPIAIVRPDLKIVALDSTEKKVKYVQSVSDTLGLNVKTVFDRAENLAKNMDYREKFDIVTSRAVARFNILSELCLPFVKENGKLVVMKGAAGQEEFTEAQKGISILGGDDANIFVDILIKTNNETENRSIIEVTKQRRTPNQYPRQFGQIKKKPL